MPACPIAPTAPASRRRPRRAAGRRALPLIVAILGAGWTSLASAQGVVELGRPDAVLAEPFSQVRGVRELADGRVLVTDWIEERLVVIDPGFARVTPLGRTGAGPQEYRLPAALWPMAGDSTLLSDVGNGRFLVVTPQGRFARVIPTERPGLGSTSGVDAQGRLYFAMPAWARGPSRLPEDSLEVFRYDPRTDRTERLAVVKGMTPRANRGPRLTPGFPMVALAGQDAWRVLPSGDLLVVRTGDYRVERIGAAGTSSGPSHQYQPEPVRPADRTDFVRDFMARSPTSGRGPDGGMGHSPVASEAEIAQMVETNEFAATLPPFERALLAPDGELWVQRGRHAGAPTVWDRFDTGGRRIGQVRTAANQLVVAIGRRHLYVSATDADGLQNLERHLRPR